NTVIATLNDGTVVELSRTPEGLFRTMPDGSVIPVDPETIIEAEDAYVSERGYVEAAGGNSFQHVFFPDTIESSLKVITRRNGERKATSREILRKLGDMSDPRNGVTIRAVRVSGV